MTHSSKSLSALHNRLVWGLVQKDPFLGLESVRQEEKYKKQNVKGTTCKASWMDGG